MNLFIFHVSGTHCHACKVMIEDVLGEQPGVKKVSVDLAKQTVTVESEIPHVPETVVQEWSRLLEPHKYRLSLVREEQPKETKSLVYAVPLGLVLLGLFFLLQKSGVIQLDFEDGLTPWAALLIGVIASLSTCLAVVGGLVLSLSAKVSQEVSTVRPFVFFHLGRLVSFTVLGGVLGAVGSAAKINGTAMAILGIFAALIMLILGLNLLDVFHVTKRLQLALPRHFSDRIMKIENGFFAPFIVGAGTFFLPCGFTQSMQFMALTSGSFVSGSLIMTSFALGTLPMLSLLSFGSFRFAHTRYAPIFFRTAGVVVVGFGIFGLLAALAGLGIIRPLFNI